MSDEVGQSAEYRGDSDPIILVAHYASARTPPTVYRVAATDLGEAVSEAIALVGRLVAKDGGRLPDLVVSELLGNLVHAGGGGAVVSVLDAGHTLRVSDRGPGIRDKERAQLPGFTTAGPGLRTTIRGVGSGLGLVRESLSSIGGHLEIDDNLGGGTAVTARVPEATIDDTAKTAGPERPELTERQLRTLLLIVELGPVGPTPLARELNVSASTAYRDLVALEQAGFIESEGRGSRTISDEGLAYLKTVL